MDNHEILAEIELLKVRNKRVELDKAWEISWTRKLLIASITYIIASFWLWTIDEADVFLKAVVPTVGYILSTVSIPYARKLWIQNNS